MNTLQTDDLDTDTKRRLFQQIADLVAEEIDTEQLGPSYTRTDPGSLALFVNKWWADVLLDAYNDMARMSDRDVTNIIGFCIHGVPVQPEHTAHIPTVREPVGVEGEVDMGYRPDKRLVINEDVEVDAEELVAELEREREE